MPTIHVFDSEKLTVVFILSGRVMRPISLDYDGSNFLITGS